MQHAYECEEEFGRSGRVVKRVRRVGGIVCWSAVGIVALVLGRELPPVFWGYMQTNMK